MQPLPPSRLVSRKLTMSRSVAIAAWVLLLASVAAALAVFFAVYGWSVGNIAAIAALSGAAAVAERQRIRLTSRLEESVSLVPTLFAAVLFGPLAAMIVGAASFV